MLTSPAPFNIVTTTPEQAGIVQRHGTPPRSRKRLDQAQQILPRLLRQIVLILVVPPLAGMNRIHAGQGVGEAAVSVERRVR